MPGDPELARYSNTMGADWGSAASGGSGTGVGVDATAGENRPVPDADIPGHNHIIHQKRSVTITPMPQISDDGKTGLCVTQDAYLKKYKNIPEYRREAEFCFQRSELTTDRTAKLRWLTLADAWLMMAGSVAKNDGHDGSGASSYQYLQRENEGAVSPFLISSVANRRKYRRHRVLKEGKITNSGMRCLADVVIRDLSESGARVQLPASQALPDDFGLYIVAEGLLYPAMARWREEKALGIQFVGEPRATTLQTGVV
ncbi:MAG: PilZ domain-containing protein [Verrucomicrobiota bacterium]